MPASGWLPNVVPDQTIESAWGNDIRNRTVTPFADAAARSAAITAPIPGMATYLLNTKQLEWWNGTKWMSSARGFHASKGLSGTAGFNNTWYDISAGGVTWTPLDARIYMVTIVTCWYLVSGSNRALNVRGVISGGGTGTFCQSSNNIGQFGELLAQTLIGIVQPTAGVATTVRADASCNHNLDIGMAAAPATNAMLIVDIGPQ